MNLDLKDKRVLVTGSYRGTGAVIAARFLAEGARVIVHGMEPGQAEAAVAELRGGAPFTCDLTQDSARAALAELVAEYTPQILVNNYGTASSGHWGDGDEQAWERAWQQNLMSAVRCSEAVLPAMKDAGWGRIVNLGTIGSTRPNARMPHYYAAKGALANMNASLALAVAGSGIRVNLVSPGLIATPEVRAQALERSRRKGGSERWEDVEAELAKDIPIGRITRRSEVADLVLFLASERADAIHGQNIRIDGGQLGVVS
ncbi:MAG: SDR family NAD(P)-dependent oxidoreductase [Pseudomonadota bacterium]